MKKINMLKLLSKAVSKVTTLYHKIVDYVNIKATVLCDEAIKKVSKFFSMAMERFYNVCDYIEDYSTYSQLKEKHMTDEERSIFITISFYAFTIMFVPFMLSLPIMIFRGYPSMVIVITFLSLNFALPATVLVMFRKFFWLFSKKIDFFFQKYSLPIIGQKEEGKMFCKRQMKIYKPLRNMSISIIVCYIIMKIADAKSIEFLRLFFDILLSIISWGSVTFMAIIGIYFYTMCLVSLRQDVIRQGEPKRLKVFCNRDIWNMTKEISFKKHKYVPKRLAIEDTSAREKNFSLSKLVDELRVNYLGARVKSD